MRKNIISILLIPYLIYAILFYLEKARVDVASNLLSNRYFLIMIICYLSCGVLLYQLVKSMMHYSKPKWTSAALLVHTLVFLVVWILIKNQIIGMLPIYQFLEISFLMIGIYVGQIIFMIRKR